MLAVNPVEIFSTAFKPFKDNPTCLEEHFQVKKFEKKCFPTAAVRRLTLFVKTKPKKVMF